MDGVRAWCVAEHCEHPPGPLRWFGTGESSPWSGGNDTIWLQLNGQGNPWIFSRKGNDLEIYQAVNRAQADEVPSFAPGNRQWTLEKQ